MNENKHHWYDGWFYDKIISPNQDRLFGHIKTLIESDSNVIDVGCGTGRLAFTISAKCSSVLGIDLSRSNIERANMTLSRKPDNKISFRHTNIAEIIREGMMRFDYAVLTYVIHEVDEKERVKLLNEIGEIADKIIIGDYLVPGRKGFGSILSEVIEFMAGKEHYRNYKSYALNGGIDYLANKSDLSIKNELIFQSYNNHIVILTR